jgi:hypothetical protein
MFITVPFYMTRYHHLITHCGNRPGRPILPKDPFSPREPLFPRAPRAPLFPTQCPSGQTSVPQKKRFITAETSSFPATCSITLREDYSQVGCGKNQTKIEPTNNSYHNLEQWKREME